MIPIKAMRRRAAILVSLWAIVLTACPSTAQTTSQTAPTIGDQQAEIEAAIRRLTAEAEGIDRIERPEFDPVFERPHPALRDFTPDMGELVLRRMTQPLTGNDHYDIYIRWHLIEPVKSMLADRFDQYKQTGERQVSKQVDEQIIRLLRSLTAPVRIERFENEHWVPKTKDHDKAREIAKLHRKLESETSVRIGYPPFDRGLRDDADKVRAAPAHRKAQIQASLEKLRRLRHEHMSEQDETTKEQARYANERLRNLENADREYRNDLMYALIQTGSPASLQRVADELARLVKDNNLAAFDLLTATYDATLNGYLGMYDDAQRDEFASKLESTARGTDRYRNYLRNGSYDWFRERWISPTERNFADYAFPLIEILRSPITAATFQPDPGSRLPVPRPARSRNPASDGSLDLDRIQNAMQRAISEIYSPTSRNNKAALLWGVGPRGYFVGNASHVHESYRHGHHALINWALLSAGQSYQDPRLYQRIYWVLTSDEPWVYSRAMRLQMLARLSPDRWRPWVRRDARWMSAAMTEMGGFNAFYVGDRDEGWGNNADSQFGVLGLWAAQEADYGIPLSAWKAIDAHWRLSQQDTPGLEPAGWAYGMLNLPVDERSNLANARDVTAPMTAGGVSALTLTERYLQQDTKEIRIERSPELLKGINWLDQNFSLTSFDPSRLGMNPYYYLWTMQRVGHATGLRTFNGVDWFHEGVETLLGKQDHDGLWSIPGPEGQPTHQLTSTGFALLFLSEAIRPIAIAKIDYEGNWNNRPNDLWNFVDYASSTYEVESTWQIFNLDQPVYQLNESPILYLSGDEGFNLSAKQIGRLRDYIDAGGLLLINPDKAGASMAKSINQLVTELYPDRELETIEANHPLYGLHSEVRASVQMRAVTNGVRPLVITFVRDIGQDLQSNDVGRSESFVALSNIYLYTVGMNPRRQRLVSNYLPEPRGGTAPSEVEVARIKHSGDFDPEPGALTQLNRLLQGDHGVKMNPRTVEPAQLGDAKIAFLTTTGDGKLTDAEAKAIRDWLDTGGTLWMDAAGGSQSAAEALAAMLEQISPDARPTPLASDDPIIDGRKLRHVGYDNRRVRYRLYALRNTGVTTSPRITAVYLNERPAIIYSPDDLTAGLAGLDHWGIFGYDVDSARHLAVNGVLSVMGK